MRSIYLWSLSLLLLCYSGVSSASTLTTWNGTYTSGHASATDACVSNFPYAYNPQSINLIMQPPGADQVSCNFYYNGENHYHGSARKSSTECPYGDNGNSCNASCDAPNSMVDGQCVAPPPDPCEGQSGQAAQWKKTWASYGDYSSPGETTNNDGCGMTITSMQCAQSGATGEYACWGDGQYTGVSGSPGDIQSSSCVGSSDPACNPVDPVTSTQTQSCTPNASGSFTCTSSSGSSQYSSSQCSMGTVNGVTGYHCVKPNYEPQSSSNTKNDSTTTTDNGDGTTTTTTTSVSDNTHCVAGDCKTTTTTTTTTTTKDAAGNTLDENKECTGPNCDAPVDETEPEELIEREVSGGDCSASLSCKGDAIDCAVLEQQKLMRCSMDWDAQKSSVLAEAGKPEYSLETEERDMAGLFTGPSTARWLTASCPADRVINLQTTGTSITFSWDFVCQYASGLGNLLVALASLFFAVYVGRAFGGS